MVSPKDERKHGRLQALLALGMALVIINAPLSNGEVSARTRSPSNESQSALIEKYEARIHKVHEKLEQWPKERKEELRGRLQILRQKIRNEKEQENNDNSSSEEESGDLITNTDTVSTDSVDEAKEEETEVVADDVDTEDQSQLNEEESSQNSEEGDLAEEGDMSEQEEKTTSLVDEEQIDESETISEEENVDEAPDSDDEDQEEEINNEDENVEEDPDEVPPTATITEVADTTTAGLVSINFDDGWQSQYDNAVSIIENAGFHATFFVISADVGEGDYMSWNEIDDLASRGHEIGNHSAHHSDLTELQSDELRKEINEGRDAIENRGIPVFSFAYPYGYYNTRVVNAVKDSGATTGRRREQMREQ